MRHIATAILLLLGGLCAAQPIDSEYLVKYRPGIRPPAAVVAQPISLRRNLWRVYSRRAISPIGVEYIEPNYRIHLLQVNDPAQTSQWYLPRINAFQGWQFSQGSPSVVVAVLDSGVDSTHYDLAGKVLDKASFVGGDATDRIGHGTRVCGIIGAITNNGAGMASVGYNTSLIVAKVVTDTNQGSDATLIPAIDWAVARGAKVINMSVGQREYSQSLQEAVDAAWEQGVVVVAAAGNNGNTDKVYPAALNNCIAVAGVDQNDRRATFSSYGSWVHTAAPAVHILSTIPGNRLNFDSGTSFSSPMVAGAAALLWANGGRSNYLIRRAIETSGSPIQGFGNYPCLRLDLRQALLRFP